MIGKKMSLPNVSLDVVGCNRAAGVAQQQRQSVLFVSWKFSANIFNAQSELIAELIDIGMLVTHTIHNACEQKSTKVLSSAGQLDRPGQLVSCSAGQL